MAQIHWLRRSPGFDRSVRWIIVLSTIVVLLMLAAALALLLWTHARFGGIADAELQDSLALVSGLLLVACCGGLLLVPIVLPTVQAMRARIGADGARIHVLLHDGRGLVLLPREVMHTRQGLLVRELSFPLWKRSGESLYSAGEVETWISPLLAEANRLGPWQALGHQWRYRDRRLLWPLASTAALALLLVFVTWLQQAYGAAPMR